MSRSQVLAQRKQLILARLQLQRMETTLRAAELRDAFRPVSLFGSAIAHPAALISHIDTVASLFGLHRFARLARLAAVGLVVFRIVRNWRGSPRAAQEPPAAETPP
jgi:hypothetical protein